MKTIILDASKDKDFLESVAKESGQDVRRCYQCGKCTAGCPFSFVYDHTVSQVMRMVQAGQKEAVLSSKSIWLCGSCQACTTRCPCNIDVAAVMETLRHMARREGYAKEKGVKTFWDTFLNTVERHGRVYELGLVVEYVAKTGRVFTDVDLAPTMLLKRKLDIKPHDIEGKQAVGDIIRKYKARKTT